MRNGRPYRILRGHRRAITSIVFSSDSAVLATAGADSDVRIWNVANGTHFALQRRAFGPLAEVALEPTGRWVAGAAPISVILWSRTSGRQLFYVRGHTGVLTSVSFAPDAETVLTSSRDGTVRTYDCDVCADRDALVHLAKVRLVQTR
jgi:WD40 repeat protein